MKHPLIQSDNLHCAACQGFPERNLGSVDQIDSLSAETRMGLVFYNKYDVSCKQKCGFCRQTEEHLYGIDVLVFLQKSPNSEFWSDCILPGTLFGPWSPSSGNVIFVPGFQPFLTVIVKIFSLILDVWPSSFITC